MKSNYKQIKSMRNILNYRLWKSNVCRRRKWDSKKERYIYYKVKINIKKKDRSYMKIIITNKE